MKIITDIRLNIDEDEVLRYQGLTNDNQKRVPVEIVQITREEIKQGLHLFEPKGILDSVRIKQISVSKKKIYLKNGCSLQFSNSMINLFEGIDSLIVGVVTIGSSLENQVSRFFTAGEYPRAIALDAVGTVAVRFFRDQLTSLACQESREQGMQTTTCFSPGSVDWNISQQKNIFQMIPVEKIGVSLTESYMMVPQKSLSWIIGVGRNIRLSSKNKHSCQICQAINCQFRKTF